MRLHCSEVPFFNVQSTGHRLMTEFLLAEIGRRPASDRCKDREGYSLAAGLALGMVTLGRGADGGAIGLADLHIQDRLHRYMVGGKDPDAAAAAAGNDPSKCSRIREGEYVNTEVAHRESAIDLLFCSFRPNVHCLVGDRAGRNIGTRFNVFEEPQCGSGIPTSSPRHAFFAGLCQTRLADAPCFEP